MTFRDAQNQLQVELCHAVPFVIYSIIYIRLQFVQEGEVMNTAVSSNGNRLR